MSYTIGDGVVALALAGGIVGYIYVKHQSAQKKIEITLIVFHLLKRESGR